jgi:hypothetical protein
MRRGASHHDQTRAGCYRGTTLRVVETGTLRTATLFPKPLYSQPAEHNPLAHALLARHPALFAGAAVAWAVAFSAIVLLWRHRAAGWVAVLLAFGHAIGGSTWLARHGPGGWALAVVYLMLAAWFARASWRRAGLIEPAQRIRGS